MNRRINTFIITMCAIMLVSCQSAPKVIAELEGNYPSRQADSVMVYEVGEAVPTEAKAIGKVKVTDGGLTPTYNCLYGNMLALAVRKTAESGGNVLRIDEHKKPAALGSTCHRVWGTMMLMPDSLVNIDTMTSLQEIEMNKDKELADMTREKISKVEKLFNNPHDILRLNAGPGWITSEVETPTRVYKRKNGFSASADYLHFWKKGLGIGINYMFYRASFDEGFDMNIHYIGPSIVYGMNLGKKWRWDLALGLGYANYRENILGYYGLTYYDLTESQNRLGFITQIGIEYKVAGNFAIGFQLNGLIIRLKKPEGYNVDKYDFYGIKRTDTQLGLRIYL